MLSNVMADRRSLFGSVDWLRWMPRLIFRDREDADDGESTVAGSVLSVSAIDHKLAEELSHFDR